MMKRKVTARKKKSQHSQILFYVLLPLCGLAILLFAFGNKYFFGSHAQELQNIIVLMPNPDVAHPNLQLRTFPIITIPAGHPPVAPSMIPPQTPPSTPIAGYCPVDDIKSHDSSCKCIDTNAVACPAPNANAVAAPTCPADYPIPFRLPPGFGPWFCVKLGSPGMTSPLPPPAPAGCSNACIAKPVVYLYPTQKTKVSVSVTTPGEIIASDPFYPVGGWKDVIAYPNGKLEYQGKTYSELFYESSLLDTIQMPERGIVIKKENIQSELETITYKLGLIRNEQKEFLDFWVPLLQKQNAPYIYFSILPQDVKDTLDQLHVSPEPDTRIEFVAYFKALQKPIAVNPLVLPENPPVRNGFTEVEWGGTIGK